MSPSSPSPAPALTPEAPALSPNRGQENPRTPSTLSAVPPCARPLPEHPLSPCQGVSSEVSPTVGHFVTTPHGVTMTLCRRPRPH